MLKQFEPRLISAFDSKIAESITATSKVVCVGRNYIAHAKELDNPVPKEPLLFIKSSNTLTDLDNPILIPKGLGECHHELEVALLIGRSISHGTANKLAAIKGIGVGLDLTLRELQSKLKSKGHPWERAKSFDGACPVSKFVSIDQFENCGNIEFSMNKNGKQVQAGNTSEMIFNIERLLSDISSCFTLYPGDIVLTGTPQGVAKLSEGDTLEIFLQNQRLLTTTVI